MAARRKSAGKKARSKRTGRRASKAEVEKKRKRLKRVVSAAKKRKPSSVPKKRARGKKASPRTKKKAAREKPILPLKKTAARKKPLSPPKRKTGRKKVPPPPKKKSRARARFEKVQRELSRAITEYTSLFAPRPYTRTARKETFAAKRAALVRAFLAAGFPPSSVRARIGWITRRRNIARLELAQIRAEILGRRLLHGRRPEDLIVLETMARERDRRYLQFLAEADAAGLSHEEAHNEWFSPKIQGE